MDIVMADKFHQIKESQITKMALREVQKEEKEQEELMHCSFSPDITRGSISIKPKNLDLQAFLKKQEYYIDRRQLSMLNL